jgi:hypothetical protein
MAFRLRYRLHRQANTIDRDSWSKRIAPAAKQIIEEAQEADGKSASAQDDHC